VLAHEQTVVQLNARRLAASVSLIKALGAGWSADEGRTGVNGRQPAMPTEKLEKAGR
jgi:hypothetical protein